MVSDAVKQLQAALAASKQGIARQNNSPQLTDAEIAEQLRTTEIQNIISRKDKQDAALDEQNQPEEILISNIHASLQSIVANFSTKELVSKDIRYILSTLQSHPNLRSILQPEDIGVMVKGLQLCYAGQVKTASVSKEKRAAKISKVEEISDMLSGMGLD